MITKVVLAKLSPTMEEGTIVRWAKNEGDPVKVGDVLAEIETDKANMEMESLGAGVLRKILVPAGGKAPVGSLIGVIADPGEDIAALTAKAAAPAASSAPQPQAAPAAAGGQPAPPPERAQPAPPPERTQPAAQVERAQAAPPAQGAQPGAPARDPATAAASAAAKAAPADQSASAASAARSASESPAPGPATTRAAAPAAPAPEEARRVAPAAAEGGRVKASPLARSMAAQRQIPLTSVAGSGPGGRIIKRDIEAWSGGGAAAAEPAAAREAPAAPAGPAPGEELPLSNMRRTIARRLAESKFSAPHFYVTVEIPMDAAALLREQLKLAEAKVSYNDMIVKACGLALARFPLVNASWGEDRILTHASVDVGVAVAIPDGLIVPVVRGADRKPLLEIARETKDLAERARERKLKPEEFSGATFTTSNLGMMDVTEFTAIINPPGVAILAIGAVRKLPVVVNDQLAIGHRMNVTLSCDHRVVDGALGARFLQEVRRLLENPVSLLL
jgi:pyruvate dehydrogenase E2 component (dihydrolipoamide acetyltransferase)